MYCCIVVTLCKLLAISAPRCEIIAKFLSCQPHVQSEHSLIHSYVQANSCHPLHTYCFSISHHRATVGAVGMDEHVLIIYIYTRQLLWFLLPHFCDDFWQTTTPRPPTPMYTHTLKSLSLSLFFLFFNFINITHHPCERRNFQRFWVTWCAVQ